MKTIVFATNNKHKLEEIRALLHTTKQLDGRYEILGLNDIGITEDIPETADTLEGNALQKARFVNERTGYNCFADDTGLEIPALEGRPGVYSARYAGEGCSFEDNIDKILDELRGIKDRTARFRTVIALIVEGKEYFFEGVVNGEILEQRQGKGGFGYDPVFQPLGCRETFAEMGMEEKNAISHRGEAVRKLLKAL